MIIVTGIEGTSEHDTALAIRAALTKLWPGCDTSPADEELIRIAANAKISGYKVSDIDVLTAAKLRPGRGFVPRRAVRDRNGSRVVGPVAVSNFIAAIEVKDHDPSGVRITGDSVDVRYANGGAIKWSSATAQNVDQTHAIKTYLEHQQVNAFVHRAIIMRGFDKPPCPGVLGGAFDGASFLTCLAENSPVSSHGRTATLRSVAAADLIERTLATPVFRVLAPTSLDRKRMDRIVTRNEAIDSYVAAAGQKMLRLRGRGGAGKTVMLLQTAWRLFDERAARSIVLTYNHALVSDIRRLMALMNIPSSPAEGGIAVRTVMSFVTAWLARFGLIDDAGGWLSAGYEAQCTEALEMIRSGAITRADIDAALLEDPHSFAFDHVVADEAQDWPGPELELIKALYGPERLCLADGVDQLIRGKAADWEHGVPDAARHTVALKRCLRMKANLAVFSNALADRVGINWKVEPNTQARGGRVILVSGSLQERRTLTDGLLNDAKIAGNEPVDLLFCVPPSGVRQAPDGARSSSMAAALAGWTHDVWDGADIQQRRDFPRSVNSLRVVQYASCRGLEGWTVLLDGFDEFWAGAKYDALSRAHPPEDMRSQESAAADHAWRQSFIPLTRAIDTLVIGINDPESCAARALYAIARERPDLVEVATPSSS